MHAWCIHACVRPMPPPHTPGHARQHTPQRANGGRREQKKNGSESVPRRCGTTQFHIPGTWYILRIDLFGTHVPRYIDCSMATTYWPTKTRVRYYPQEPCCSTTITVLPVAATLLVQGLLIAYFPCYHASNQRRRTHAPTSTVSVYDTRLA